jgi:hypothetical protein
MQVLNLDLSEKRLNQPINAKQLEVGRKFAAILTDNAVPYIPEKSSVFTVWYKSENSGSGNYSQIDGRDAVVLENNVATVELIPQMLINAGSVELCLVLNSADGRQIGFWNINCIVEEIPGAGSDEATEYYTALSETAGKAIAAAERAEASAETVIEEIAKRTQLKPEFANSIEECTDTTKLYVLPDGYIYAYMQTTVAKEPVNMLPLATDTDRETIYNGVGYAADTRLSSSGETSASTGVYATGFIPAVENDVLTIEGLKGVASGISLYLIVYDSSNTKIGHKSFGFTSEGILSTTPTWYTFDPENNIVTIPLTSANFGSGFNAVRFSTMSVDDLAVYVNKDSYSGTTTVTQWANTGHAFVPADYEDRIIELETATAQNTADIETLKKGVVDTGGLDALTWIRNWDAPIYDRVPAFLLDREKPAVAAAEKTVDAVYAKYDALMAANSRYITRTDMGMCSDGVTPVYRYDFREPEPHHQSGMQWSETKPTVIIVSGIHNEWGGIYSLYYAMEEIANNPGLDDLRRNVHFVIVPVMNPYCIVGPYSDTYHVRNANGVEIHRNFEVGFKYPTDSGYIAEGEIHHGGTEPLSEVETQYIDNIFKEYPDAALFMTCHSAQRDTRWGTGFIWASTATEYTCNLGYRLVDKMSKAWHAKYGTAWEEGCVRENEYVLADTDTYPYATALEAGDYRAGHAHVSSTNGTETRQATKYGIQGANVEVLDTFWVLDATNLGSKVTTHGAEVYINYLLSYMGCYDHKDKKEYAPSLPLSE